MSKSDELLATIEKQRAELNELKNSGATKAELTALRAEIQTNLDAPKTAKATPAPATPEGTHEGQGERKSRAPRFGFFGFQH